SATSRPPTRPTLFPYTTLFRSTSPPAPAWRWQMKVGICSALILLGLAQINWAQTTNSTDSADAKAAISKSSASYSVFGARPKRRSEEHTSELQSRRDLVCRLLL